MTNKQRVTNVQVPGAPAATPAAEGAGAAVLQAKEPEGGSPIVDVDALQSANAELAAKLQAAEEALALAQKSGGKPALAKTPGGHIDYRNTPADQIDATKLTRSVESKDGWVVPPTLGVPPKQPQ